jgi:putative FmdB family regulatory protein
MPIYEYRCTNGHNFEVMQRMTDDPVTKCEICGAPVERVFHPIAVHFKGKGFYNTDYGTRRRQRELASSAESGANATAGKGSGASSDGSDGAGGSSSSDSSSSKPADSKKSTSSKAADSKPAA